LNSTTPTTPPTAPPTESDDLKTVTSSATISFINTQSKEKRLESPVADNNITTTNNDQPKFKSTKVFAAPKSLLSFNTGPILDPSPQQTLQFATDIKPTTGPTARAPKPSSLQAATNYKSENLAVNKSAPICNRYTRTAPSPPQPDHSAHTAHTGPTLHKTVAMVTTTVATNTDIDCASSEAGKKTLATCCVSIGTMTEFEVDCVEGLASAEMGKRRTATAATSTRDG